MDKTTNSLEIDVLPSEAPEADAPGAPRRWARFLAGLLGMLLFAFGVIPALERLGPVREVRDAIRKAGIDATALFYTESDVSCEADASIRNALTYSARRTCPSPADIFMEDRSGVRQVLRTSEWFALTASGPTPGAIETEAQSIASLNRAAPALAGQTVRSDGVAGDGDRRPRTPRARFLVTVPKRKRQKRVTR